LTLSPAESVPFILERLFREESGRIQATLIRLLGDFDLAEEAFQEAMASALATWPRDGIPASPRAWVVASARNRALDVVRRSSRWAARREQLARSLPASTDPVDPDDRIADDVLRLVFTCCHPALAPDARVALTLRTVCGLSTDEIARAFLVPVATLSQRLVRAKAKIRDAGIPYEVPPPDRLADRLDSVLSVVYVVFTEGYAATSGDALVRRELCGEAIRLARLLTSLVSGPDTREVNALLALMLLHDARRDARQTPEGDLVRLADQDRARWDRTAIAEGLRRVEESLAAGPAGPYAVEAAIAALHARAARPEETDWPQIAALYAFLLHRHPSPVVALNHAVAVGMADGPARGLLLLDALESRGELPGYHLLPAARADFLERLGRRGEAAQACREALRLARLEPERRFLRRRLAELEG